MFMLYWLWQEFNETLRNIAASYGAATVANVAPSTCELLAKLAVTDQTGTFEYDKQELHPVTFHVLLPLFRTLSLGSLPHGYVS